MNKIISLITILSLSSCSSIGKKDTSQKIHQIGHEFEKSPIKVSFLGNYVDTAGKLKSEAKAIRKKQLLDSVKVALKAAFNMGAIEYELKDSYWSKNALSKFSKKMLGEGDYVYKLINDKYVPDIQSVSYPTNSKDTFKLTNFVRDNSKSLSNCSYQFHLDCEVLHPAALYYQVGKQKASSSAPSIILPAIAAKPGNIIIPSLKIYKKHKNIMTGLSFNKINLIEKSFIKKYSVFGMSKTYKELMRDKFHGCIGSGNEHGADFSDCLEKHRKVNDYYTKLPDSEFRNIQAKNKLVKASVWGTLYLLNTDIEITRIDKQKFKIDIIINTPKLYEHTKKVSDFIE